jgi:deoxyribodipyrimidine photo-lyase
MSDPISFSTADPRVRRLNDRPTPARGDYVLYWMQVSRRGEDNAALAYAIERANELGVPCIVYEALRTDYPYASDRIHAFVLQGARDTAATLKARGIAHVFFLPRTPDEARGVLSKLAARARLVVSDDHPSFVVPAHNAAAAARVPCPFVVVDDCAVVPLSLLAKPEIGARTIRPRVTRALDAWLRPIHEPAPRRAPPAGLDVPFDPVRLAGADTSALVAACAIDHAVPAVDGLQGGSDAALHRLERFARGPLSMYAVDRNDPSRDGTSALSPYLHFGMLSARRAALVAREWGRGEGLDAFLEQLLVRRALAFNFARSRADHATYAALPAWARATLEEHAADRRYADLSIADLEAARSPDPLWNAAMNELRTRGVVHGYARMLWGKLPLLWMRRPRDAHHAMVTLNDRWALDGRDPNGYANVSWCYGLHDRPWPKRPVFGAVRTMTSASARKKLDFEGYIERWTRDDGTASVGGLFGRNG